MSTTPEPMTGVSAEVLDAATQAVRRFTSLNPVGRGIVAMAVIEAVAPLLVADAVAERDAEIARRMEDVERWVRWSEEAAADRDAARAELAGVVAAVEAVLARTTVVLWGRQNGKTLAGQLWQDLRAALSSTGAGEALARVRAEDQREHRLEWADWIEQHDGNVGVTPLTVSRIITALRSAHPPFGRGAGATEKGGGDE